MIEPKFKIGDVVWGAESYKKEKQVICPDCLGKMVWSVSLPNGERFTLPCHTCEHGYDGCSGTIPIWEQNPIVTQLTIGSVRIDTNDEIPISYMCNETGVGSGTVYNEEDLFDNELDALKVATDKSVEIVREHNKERKRIFELGKKRSYRNPLRG